MEDVGRKIDQNDGRVEALRDSVQQLSAELAQAASDVERRSEEAAFAFREESKVLVAAAEDASAKAADTHGFITSQITEMVTLAQRCGELSDHVHEMLAKPVADLNAAAQFAERTAEAARGDILRLSEDVETQIQRLLDTTRRLHGDIDGVGQEIESKAKLLLGATDTAIRNVGGLDMRVEEQADRMSRVLNEALDRAADLGQLLKTQSEALNRATLAAKAEIDALTQARQRARSENFLALAADIVAELGTLSIDITTLLDSEVPLEVWKRYRAGDRSSFVRRLIEKKDAYLLPALVERYEKDLKLRDLVTRFIARFEELIDGANKADPDHILNTTFLTADIGKLYLLIQRNLGKQAAQ
jgi:ABC-type transporter Mla subunit MlaD